MTRPTPSVTLPAPWSHHPDATVELAVRRMRAQFEREERRERRFERVAAVRFGLIVAALATVCQFIQLGVMHP